MKSLIGIGTLSVLGIGTAFTVVGCSCSPVKEKKLSFNFMTGGENEFNRSVKYNYGETVIDRFQILDEDGTFLPLEYIKDSSSYQEQNDAVKITAV
jgi:hypothetical protein